MKLLYPEEIGSLLPTIPWIGEVFSTHTHVINILHPDSYLISIIDRRRDMSPLGIRVDSLPIRMQSGMTVVGRGDCLILDDSVSIRLTKGSQYDGTIDYHPSPLPLMRKAVHRECLIRELSNELFTVGNPAGLMGLITDSTANLYTRKAVVCGITCSREHTNAKRKAKLDNLPALIGLGPGFTPSGDDFISGAILASTSIPFLYEGEDAMQKNPVLPIEEIKTSLHNTTEGGKTLLYLACHRQFPRYMKRFAKRFIDSVHENTIASECGIAVGDTSARCTIGEDLRTGIVDAVSFGETSGTDMMTGFLWYLSLL